MMAPRVASPKTGKRAPPKSPELEAIICVFCAISATSRDLMASTAGEDTVNRESTRCEVRYTAFDVDTGLRFGRIRLLTNLADSRGEGRSDGDDQSEDEKSANHGDLFQSNKLSEL